MHAFSEYFKWFPCLGCALDFKGEFFEWDLGVGAIRGDTRQEGFVMELEGRLDHSYEPCTGFEVSDVGLDRADPCMGLALEVLVPEGWVAVGHFQATDFDGITKLGPGSMGFYVSDRARVDLGIGKCGPDRKGLCDGIRCGESDAPGSDTQARSFDDCIDTLRIAHRIG